MGLLLAAAPLAGSAHGGPKSNFDSNWLFVMGDEASGALPASPEWRRVDLPHDWSVLQPFRRDAPAGNDGGYLPTGTGHYQKTFRLPRTGGKHWLYFEGVYMNSTVSVNGRRVGGHPYGYSSFFCDITDAVRKGDNTVTVAVDNSRQKNCRWYSGSGIYRHVWLVSRPLVYLAHWGTRITTPDLHTAVVSVDVVNEDTKPFRGAVSVTVGAPVERPVELAPGERKTVTLRVEGKAWGGVTPQPWSVDAPKLYTARLALTRGRKVVDTDVCRFGLRTISYSPETGFLLNGREVKLNGACLHHDNGILGAAAFDEAEVRKVRLMKDAGFNALRTSHNPPSERFLEACDSLGMLVIDESFDGWREAKNKYDYHTLFDEWADRDVEAMVLRDRNHPSVVCWSVGNEIIERKSPGAVATAHRLRAVVRRLDDTRPVTSALAAWDSDWEIYDPLAAQQDIVGYNYMMHKAEGDHQRVPGRMMWQTESYPRDAFANWKRVQDHRYIFGDFVWTGLDYLGESGIGRWWYAGDTPGEHYQRPLWPAHAAYCGDVDLTGWRKPVSHYRGMLWNAGGGERLYMAVYEPDGYKGKISTGLWAVWPAWESWNWPGWESRDIDVVVYTREPKVRLLLNGETVGEKAVSDSTEWKAVFRLPYREGTLRAEAGGASVTLSTAGAPARVVVEREAGGRTPGDVSFYQVRIVDKDGNLCPQADNLLRVEVDGGATLQALGNADIGDTDPYYDAVHRAWKGRALLVVRQGGGAPRVKVSSQGLQPASLDTW